MPADSQAPRQSTAGASGVANPQEEGGPALDASLKRGQAQSGNREPGVEPHAASDDENELLSRLASDFFTQQATAMNVSSTCPLNEQVCPDLTISLCVGGNVDKPDGARRRVRFVGFIVVDFLMLSPVRALQLLKRTWTWRVVYLMRS